MSDRSIGTAPHAPLQTFLSSGNNGAKQGDEAYLPFKFKAPM